MSYNFDECDIINQIYKNYLDYKHDWESELKEVILELVTYNDDENINEIINHYGGSYHLCNLYEQKYKNLKLDDKNLGYYHILAYIGLFHSTYEKLSEMIALSFDISISDDNYDYQSFT